MSKDFTQLRKEFRGVQDKFRELLKRFHELHDMNNKHDSYVDKELNKHHQRLNRQRDDINREKGQWLVIEERVDSLGGETQELTARVESMSDKLCRCQDRADCAEVGSFERNIPTPALTYEGSDDSYHTPPPAGIVGDSPVRPPLVELSSGNDSNQRTFVPVVARQEFQWELCWFPLAAT